jgi:hypothetical protein
MSLVNKKGVTAGLITIFAVGVVLAIDKRPDSPGPGASSKELVEAARRAYELQIKVRALAPAEFRADELYLWSKRWMTAEWDLNLPAGEGAKAVKAHFDRMTDLENFTITLRQANQVAEPDVAAATYYRIEAELMLARTGE